MLPLYSKTSSFRAAEGAKALLFGRAARQSKRSPSESHYKVFLLLFIAAICLVVAPHVSRMITKVDAQLAQPRSGATKAFAAAPVWWGPRNLENSLPIALARAFRSLNPVSPFPLTSAAKDAQRLLVGSGVAFSLVYSALHQAQRNCSASF